MTERLIFRDDLVCKRENDREEIGLVRQVGGVEDSDESSSDSDSDDSSLVELDKGFVKVEWINSAKSNVVLESEVEVVDRSCLPRDVVRTKDGHQLGTAMSTSVTCDLMIAGTSRTLKGVDVSELVPLVALEAGQIVVYGPWIGRIVTAVECMTLKFSNGSRAVVDPEIFFVDGFVIDVYPQREEDPGIEPYPGQMIRAYGRALKGVEWISGEKIKFKLKALYTVLIEQVSVRGVDVKWGAKAFQKSADKSDSKTSKSDEAGQNQLENKENGSPVDPLPETNSTVENLDKPPSSILTNDELKKKLHHSTSDGALGIAKSGRKKKKQLPKTSHEADQSNESDDDDQSGYDDDDEDSEYEDVESDISPSAGSCVSADTVVVDQNDVDVLVNNDSDLNVSSPVGQIPTILGTLSCRFGQFELDFALVQENTSKGKKKFQCNIQNPEYSKETIASIGKQFQSYMKTVVKKHKHLISSASCGALMAQCPHAIRAFVLQQSAIEPSDIYFEYTADGKHTSGVIDKDGKKTDVEFEDGGHDFSELSQTVQMISEVLNSVLEPDNCGITTAPAGQRQTGCKVKYQAGQWVTIEVQRTYTKVNIQWQDGTMQNDIEAKDLFPAHHVDDNDFCPGDFVAEKRADAEKRFSYGVVLKVDSKNRMAVVQWTNKGYPDQVEEVSSYEIADFEEMQFRISDVIVRTSKQPHSLTEKVDGLTSDHAVGELLRIMETGLLQVLWCNGTTSLVHPQDVINISNDEDYSLFGSSDSDSDSDDTSWTTTISDGEDGSSEETDVIGDGEQLDSTTNESDTATTNEGQGEGMSSDQDRAVRQQQDSENLVAEVQISKFLGDIVSSACEDIADEVNAEMEIADRKEMSATDIQQSKSNDKVENAANSGANAKLDENDNSAKAILFIDENTSSTSESLPSEDLPVSQLVADLPSSFSIQSSTPTSHHFGRRYFDQSSSKNFVKAIQRDLKLLRSSLPPGITVKAYEDRMDLLSVLIEGPDKTPYQDGIFCFHIYLSSKYPESPPSVHYISYSPRLNPNLYETGRVCVSLLGTWSGKGSERWTKDSTVLQVLLSIQGLILNSEPYYNEAGYEGHRGTSEGMINSRCYNEMVILRLVQHTTALILNPPEEFAEEIKQYCSKHVSLLIERVKKLFDHSSEADADSSVDTTPSINPGFPLLPLSKGVMLSLKNRLVELESAASAMDYDAK